MIMSPREPCLAGRRCRLTNDTTCYGSCKYAEAKRKERSQLLDHLEYATGLNRKTLIRHMKRKVIERSRGASSETSSHATSRPRVSLGMSRSLGILKSIWSTTAAPVHPDTTCTPYR